MLPIEDSTTGKMTEWVLARRHAVTYGIDKFNKSLKGSELTPFEIDITEDSPVLNSEISPDDASQRFQKIAKNHHKKAIEGVVLDHRFEAKSESANYVHAPYWLVRYAHQKGTFRIAVSGATEEVLFGELPVTKRYRIRKWFIAFIVMILNAIIIQFAPYVATILGSEGGGAEGATVLLLFAMLIFIALPLIMREAFLYEIEVDSEGNETREWLGDERVE